MNETVKYEKASLAMVKRFKEAVILTPEEEAELFMEPDELPAPKPTKKITIELDSDTIDFFKQVASARNTRYQPMIRQTLATYAKRYRSRASSAR
jgi:predicted DNA binding CopG/RHH family protein